jgi:hypothetical protein
MMIAQDKLKDKLNVEFAERENSPVEVARMFLRNVPDGEHFCLTVP